jgi:hypothetical protein
LTGKVSCGGLVVRRGRLNEWSRQEIVAQVLTIRCTRKLIKRLDAQVPPARAIPTNRLGDWYGNLLFTRRARLIICVSERSLLPVFVEARDPSSLISRFQERVLSVLRRMGAASDVLHSEAREMDQIIIGATANRRVLGSLNDLAALARFTIEEHPEIELGALAIELANTPCAPLSYETPGSVSLALLRRVYPNRVGANGSRAPAGRR